MTARWSRSGEDELARRRARERFEAIQVHSQKELRRLARNWAILIGGFVLLVAFAALMTVGR